MRHRIDVDGMTCTGCAAIVEREVGDVGDVTHVAADHEAGVVSFATPHPTTGSYVEQVIDDLGYVVTAHTSD
ncbi:heavy-metal-associated domain-containing protein [Halococcus agarilyticus]|uniref:heavy-metal-associated domain-containing protein n=1 Tax=Halococcus agarilyticus TaxID=1232219 RepID=UPI000677CC59|nr:heavy metal-associated domain-containing protein [Halococcus agarilyticus]